MSDKYSYRITELCQSDMDDALGYQETGGHRQGEARPRKARRYTEIPEELMTPVHHKTNAPCLLQMFLRKTRDFLISPRYTRSGGHRI